MNRQTGMTALLLGIVLAASAAGQAARGAYTLGDEIAAGNVTAKIRGTGGSSGDSIKLDVAKTAAAPEGAIEMTIPPGTRLTSGIAGEQGMVVSRVQGQEVGANTYDASSTIVVDSTTPVTYVLQAYCTEFAGDNPSEANNFTLGTPDPALAAILQQADRQHLSVSATQAAVWMHTDHLGYDQMNRKFTISKDEWDAAVAALNPPPPDTNPAAPAAGPGANAPPPAPAGIKTLISPMDGAEMVYVPAGPFQMDTDRVSIAFKPGLNVLSDNHDNPRHTVTLDGYWIYKNDVTVAQYRKFCEATGRQMPPAPGWGWKDDHPMVNVSWYDAEAYCEWALVALPTEAQWAKAASGTDGRVYPWGNDWDATKLRVRADSTAPVGSYPAGASPYGCLDMEGNVTQWCADWYGFLGPAAATNPLGPDTGRDRVARGGDFSMTLQIPFIGFCSTRVAAAPGGRSNSRGFRCVSGSDSGVGAGPSVQTAMARGGTPTLINFKDGADMVYAPAGEFIMGEDGAPDAPKHTVYLDGYWIYRNDVTVAQYRKFCRATGRRMPDAPDSGWDDDHPMVKVTWDDAKAYCDWAGVSLPTEAQWEKAARGTDGRKYPWGNDWDATKAVCNLAPQNASDSAPVGSKPDGASPYGCLDMAGNVRQWCADCYDNAYYTHSPARNPTGPATGTYRVLRGGAWSGEDDTDFLSAGRESDNPCDGYVLNGFRCVSRAAAH